MSRKTEFLDLNEDLKAFHNYLQAERGMAKNTVLAYGHDLERFSGWVVDGGMNDYRQPSLGELGNYIEFLARRKTGRHRASPGISSLSKCFIAS